MLLNNAWQRKLVMLILLAGLAACSSSPEQGYDPNSESAQSLEIPPDLNFPTGNNGLEIPSIGSGQAFSSMSGTASASGQQAVMTSDIAAFRRDGRVFWLELNMTPDDVWPKLLAFLQQEGFEIKVSEPQAGLIETNWKEGGDNLPTNWLSKLFNKIRDSGLRDRYRVRLEKTEQATTRVFVAHRGLVEIATGDQSDQYIDTMWQRRPSDPSLEAEMLQRFVVYLAGGKHASNVAAEQPARDAVILHEDGNSAYLEIRENFARGWRRTGLALDRIGLVVEDRNRSAGQYYIKLTDEYWQSHKEKDRSWFRDWFDDKDSKQQGLYIIKLDDQDTRTILQIQTRDKNPATDKASRGLLKLLNDYLR